jgi:hypothetical protein
MTINWKAMKTIQATRLEPVLTRLRAADKAVVNS